MSSLHGMTRVKYITSDGEHGEKLCYDEKVVLSHHDIVDIDLSLLPLTHLEVLDLSRNPLKTLDLTPLSKALNLRELKLHSNEVSTIDLSPLEHCINLERFVLVNHGITSLDISVFSSLSQLKHVSIVSQNLQEINLDSISACTNLTSFSFSGGQFLELNLEFLRTCTNLQSLQIGGNSLTRISLDGISTLQKLKTFTLRFSSVHELDLEPLSGCNSLETLSILSNSLTSLDLSPLVGLKKTHSIYLDFNPFSQLDLSPLADLASLEYLSIQSCSPIQLDLTPLILNYHLRTVRFECPTDDELSISVSILFKPVHLNYYFSKLDLSQTIPTLIDSGDWLRFRTGFSDLLLKLSSAARLRFQGEFLRQLGLGQYRALEINLIDMLQRCSDIHSLEQLKRCIESFLIEAMIDQVESSGPTHFLDVETLSLDSRTYEIVESLLQSRDKEIQQVSIYVHDGYIDLRPLWLTSYGYRVLENTFQSLILSNEFYPPLANILQQSGISIELVAGVLQDLSEICSFSPAMIDYILWCAQYYSPRTDEHK
ncbi:MAG: leucine-rich repeat protein [Candidatus Lokiarchaeota archaeon]|nr:leucine-rich repeat protein [Candidatus Lokiarchaeota archaeon]